MGIKNLSILYRGDPEIVKTEHLETLRGKRLAIDSGIWMNNSWISACSRHIDETNVLAEELDRDKTMSYWLNRLKDELRLLLSHGVTPVFVFDGKAPRDKDNTRAKRREGLTKARNKLVFLEEKKEELYQPADLERARRILKSSRTLPMPHDDIIRSILDALGIPNLNCNQEAERLCAALCREGWVETVLSADTDCLVHGCTKVMTKLVGKHLTAVYLHPLLNKLDLTYREFVDLCITCGCDYNTNIPRIGVKKSLKLIQDYGCIELIPHDTTCLRHLRCRELFSPLLPEELTADPLDLNIKQLPDDSRERLDCYGIGWWLDELVPLLDLPPVERYAYTRNPQPVRIEIKRTV